MTNPKLKNALRAMQSLLHVLVHHARRHGMDEEAVLEIVHHEGDVAMALDKLDDVVPAAEAPEGIVELPPPSEEAKALNDEMEARTKEMIAASLIPPELMHSIPRGEARRRETTTHVLWTLEARVDREDISGEEDCKAYGWEWQYMRHCLQSIDLVVSIEKGVGKPRMNILRMQCGDNYLVPHGVAMDSPGEDWLVREIEKAAESQRPEQNTTWKQHLASHLHAEILKRGKGEA
jgi:hypothetical protein